MKIAIDIHGVLDQAPHVVGCLMKFMRREGHEVYILSGPPMEQIGRELGEMGIKKGEHYDHVFSIVDYLKNSGVEMRQDDKGDWWCEDDDWWSSKGSFCKEAGIDVVFDDSRKYMPNMPAFTEFHLVGRPSRCSKCNSDDLMYSLKTMKWYCHPCMMAYPGNMTIPMVKVGDDNGDMQDM
jgi:hypothetical protein